MVPVRSETYRVIESSVNSLLLITAVIVQLFSLSWSVLASIMLGYVDPSATLVAGGESFDRFFETLKHVRVWQTVARLKVFFGYVICVVAIF